MIEIILAALALCGGVATYYSEAEFGGGLLYCDQYTAKALIYSEDTEDWAAFDETWYERGIVECGDLVMLVFEDEVLTVRAWDAGTFGRYWVEDWPGRPIIVDLPEHLRPDGAMSWPVVAVNLTRLGLDD